MKVKTSELTSVAIDWAVAKCESKSLEYHDGGIFEEDRFSRHSVEWLPSISWSQGGPIIETVGINIKHYGRDWKNSWVAFIGDGHWQGKQFLGDTPLIAAMRCYVAAKLGEEVEIPEKLI